MSTIPEPGAPRRVSVVIPTHDRSEILGQCLDRLDKVEPVAGVSLECVVVANACTDRTVPLVEEKSKGLRILIRCVNETRAGLNIARNRGVAAAAGDVIALLDDDAMVEVGWLHGLVDAFRRYPAALVAGRVRLLWESRSPPAWCTPRIERLLSRLDHGDTGQELDRGRAVGANLALRREVLHRVNGFVEGLDRSGRDLLSGGDTEFLMRALAAGFRMFYAPTMLVEHYISVERVQPSYLARLARARGRTRVRVALEARAARPALLSMLRLGLRQIVVGWGRELRGKLERDVVREVDGRIIRNRGAGTASASLRTLRSRRWPGADGTRDTFRFE